jgi:hypothetical protein
VSAFGDAMIGLKNVMLMQERIDGLRGDIAQTAQDLRTVTEKVQNLNERVIRIETMIDMSRPSGGTVPRIDR